MKNYIILLFSIAMLTSCFNQEEDFAYNPSAVVPVIQNFTGPTSAIANGFGESVYKVAARSGSNFTWAVSGADANIDDSDNNVAVIVFSQSAVAATATVTVTETAANGKSSESKSIEVDLSPYCALNTADYVGTAASVNDDCDYSSDVTLVAVGDTGLTLDGVMDDQVQGSWGETYDDGVGNEGNLDITLNEDGTVVIPSQHFGTTEGGTWEYWMRGSGTYNQCARTITLDYTFGDSDGSGDYYNCTVVIAMD